MVSVSDNLGGITNLTYNLTVLENPAKMNADDLSFKLQ
jgi:hypothetical protein